MDEGPSSSKIQETNDEDDDDPVIKEISLIHSKQLEQNLYLFQYPLRRRKCHNEFNVAKCFYKNQNQHVKLEVDLDVDSPNFNAERAETIAREVDGPIDRSKKDKEVYFENGIVNKIFHTSDKVVKEPENYAVAVYNGKEIHLTAVRGIFQIRPSFPYLEKGLKRKKESKEDSEDEEAGPSSAQQVTVRFKQNDDRWKKSDSYKTLQAKNAEEPWKEVEWHGMESTLSQVEKLRLVADDTYDIQESMSLNSSEYVKLLVPEDKEQVPLEPALPSHVLSLHALRALPLQEQCRLLLKDAQIVQFQQIQMLLAGNEGFSTDSLLKNLQKVAVLVRGNWVVKSEVLYPANTFSAISGVPAELMCRTRDYILYLFTKNQYVERKKVSSVMKVPAEEVKEIFTGISKLRTHNKGWELSLPVDLDFISKHQDLAQKQNLFWEQRYHQLSEFLKDNQRQRRKSKSTSESDGKARHNSVSQSSDNDSGTENKKSPIVSRKTFNGINNNVGANS